MRKLIQGFAILNAIVAVMILTLSVPTVSFAAGDDIPKFVLIKLTRDQAGTMCASKTFTECMGFTQEKCVALSEQAIELCLAPLPDEISPDTLKNSTLEECPQQIYKKEGFTEEKAKTCFAKGVEAAQHKE